MTRLLILAENRAADNGCLGEHGLSVLLESDDSVALFDTGPSSTFLTNAGRLGVQVRPDLIVLSHGHSDHTGGLRALRGSDFAHIPVIAHPKCFARRVDRHGKEQSAPYSIRDMERLFNLHLAECPRQLSSCITFVTCIPRVVAFENEPTGGHLLGEDGIATPDDVPDDSALAVKTAQGLLVICGCAHAGLVNTLRYIKQLSDLPIIGIAGGFHLTSRASEERLWKTIQYLREIGVTRIYPCHCVNLQAMAALHREFSIEMVGAGSVLEF